MVSKKIIHHSREGRIEKSVPRIPRFSSLGKPPGAERRSSGRIFYPTLTLMIDSYSSQEDGIIYKTRDFIFLYFISGLSPEFRPVHTATLSTVPDPESYSTSQEREKTPPTSSTTSFISTCADNSMLLLTAQVCLMFSFDILIDYCCIFFLSQYYNFSLL